MKMASAVAVVSMAAASAFVSFGQSDSSAVAATVSAGSVSSESGVAPIELRPNVDPKLEKKCQIMWDKLIEACNHYWLFVIESVDR
jgi:hypothetical protein